MPGLRKPQRDFRLNAVNQQASADGRSRRHWSLKAFDLHHRIAGRSASVEHQIREILELFAAFVVGAGSLRMSEADDRHHFDPPRLELFRHLDGDYVTPT